jgi:pimeloyl-ACP methyl ester carboxylesterase
VSDPSQLEFVQEERPDRSDVVRCRLQTKPARELPRLEGIPVVIIAAEASYHAAYDHCTAKYLEQAGVENTFIRLEEWGIRGNGHMVMLEQNNLRVAQLFHRLIQDRILSAAASVVTR